MFRLTCCEKTTGSGGLDNCPDPDRIGPVISEVDMTILMILGSVFCLTIVAGMMVGGSVSTLG